MKDKIKQLFDLFKCQFDFHDWYKSGGTRNGGLYRECTRCKKRERGFEDRNEYNNRIIVWYEVKKVNK